MNFPKQLRTIAFRRNMTSTSGMVLVMVLAALAVMTILLVALFTGASHQILGAQSDATRGGKKMRADSAVALVMGQIQQASTQTNQAWISQPGLVDPGLIRLRRGLLNLAHHQGHGGIGQHF